MLIDKLIGNLLFVLFKRGVVIEKTTGYETEK
jgi:hypothetical protein